MRLLRSGVSQLLIGLLTGCQETPPAPRAEASGSIEQHSEIPSQARSKPLVGAILTSAGVPRFVQYRVDNGKAVIGGDMIVGTPDQLQQQASILARLVDLDSLDPQQRTLAKRVSTTKLTPQATIMRIDAKGLVKILGWGTLGSLWPTKTVPYSIDTSIPEGTRRNNIRRAVSDWNSQAGAIRLKLVTDMTKEEIGNTATLLFHDHGDPDTEFACSSWVGYRPTGGLQRLNLNPSCKPGNIMHEIGHAMGLYHEHQRTDRAALLNVGLSIPSDPDNYDELGGRDLAPHDLCSIMHYTSKTTSPPWFTLTSAGTKALQTCSQAMSQGCREVGQRCELSGSDRASLKRLYP